MKLLKVLLTISIICIASMSFAEGKFKPAPRPHYTKELGYGWSTKVPYSTPKDPWILMKSWRTENGVSIFTDTNRDGKCDTVIEFKFDGEFAPNGKPFVIRLDDSNCIVKDIEIKRFLKNKSVKK